MLTFALILMGLIILIPLVFNFAKSLSDSDYDVMGSFSLIGCFIVIFVVICSIIVINSEVETKTTKELIKPSITIETNISTKDTISDTTYIYTFQKEYLK